MTICAVSAVVVSAIVLWRLCFCRKQEIADEQKARQAQANNFSNLGNACFINNELDKAQDYYTKALKINEQIGHKEPIAKNYISLGMILSKKGLPKQARSYWVKATDIFPENDLPEDIKKENPLIKWPDGKSIQK